MQGLGGRKEKYSRNIKRKIQGYKKQETNKIQDTRNKRQVALSANQGKETRIQETRNKKQTRYKIQETSRLIGEPRKRNKDTRNKKQETNKIQGHKIQDTSRLIGEPRETNEEKYSRNMLAFGSRNTVEILKERYKDTNKLQETRNKSPYRRTKGDKGNFLGWMWLLRAYIFMNFA